MNKRILQLLIFLHDLIKFKGNKKSIGYKPKDAKKENKFLIAKNLKRDESIESAHTGLLNNSHQPDYYVRNSFGSNDFTDDADAPQENQRRESRRQDDIYDATMDNFRVLSSNTSRLAQPSRNIFDDI